MVLTSSLKSEDEFVICFLGFNTGGLDKSSPYIKKKMGMINQAHAELIIIPGGIKG
jgi:hypothetical protein